MTFYCPECIVNWWPYQCTDGACPECGKGTRCKHSEVGDIDADARYKAAMRLKRDREDSAAKHARFEAYYEARERSRGDIVGP